MWVLVFFLAVPIIEIALFIQVGGWIGLWPTLGLVVLAAVAGAAVIRALGLQTLGRLRSSVAAGEDPSGPLADGAMTLIAGILLLMPGFFTDAVGLALLIPAVRVALIRSAARRIVARGAVGAGAAPRRRRPADAQTIEGEYEVLDDVPPSERGASGWRRPQS